MGKAGTPGKTGFSPLEAGLVGGQDKARWAAGGGRTAWPCLALRAGRGAQQGRSHSLRWASRYRPCRRQTAQSTRTATSHHPSRPHLPTPNTLGRQPRTPPGPLRQKPPRRKGNFGKSATGFNPVLSLCGAAGREPTPPGSSRAPRKLWAHSSGPASSCSHEGPGPQRSCHRGDQVWGEWGQLTAGAQEWRGHRSQH